MDARYQSLDPAMISATADRLVRRIQARFPTRGLCNVAVEVADMVGVAEHDARTLTIPARLLRSVSYAFIILFTILVVAAAALALDDIVDDAGMLSAIDWLNVTESAINDLVFVAIAVFFVLSLEPRRKRRFALRSLHRLRSLAHVIDMHQLTKDPERMTLALPDTPQSVPLDLSPAELGRYLDYCSELLALVSKTGALYAQASNDPVVLSTVSEIEDLTTALSRKIWQKIALLHAEPAAGL